MLNHLSASEQALLAVVADAEIGKSLSKAALGRSRLHEVPAVETIVRIGLRKVARRWRLLGLPFPKLALQTVFTHAAPKVSFARATGKRGKCELADLLIVIDHHAASIPEDRRRAVLVQAKLHDAAHNLHLNSGNERVQFELLSTWPRFEFEAGFYKPHSRALVHGPMDFMWSGEYGGIAQPPVCGWTQYQIMTNYFASSPPVGGAISLGSLLAGMLAGLPRYGRPAVPLGRDPWSETIEELLAVTFERPLRGKKPLSNRGRQYQLGFMNFDREVDGRFASGPARDGDARGPVDDGDKWLDGAMSVARFTVGEW